MKIYFTFFFILFFPLMAPARLAPEEWGFFIQRTELIIKGMVVEIKINRDDEGYQGRPEYAIEIVDKIDFKKKYPFLNVDTIQLNYSPRNHILKGNSVGDVGYFFIYPDGNKWAISDNDAGIWWLLDPNYPVARKYINGDEKELSFPDIYLEDIPSILYEKKYISEVEKFNKTYTEERLVNYFRSFNQ